MATNQCAASHPPAGQQTSQRSECAWNALHGSCRDASNACNALDGQPLQCATTPGCSVESVCAPACTTCSVCFNMALRFTEQALPEDSPADLGAAFVRFCRRQSDHDVDCAAVGRSLASEPELAGRQIALCSASGACSEPCVASTGEIIESLGAASLDSFTGGPLCLDAWSSAVADSISGDQLPDTAASRVVLEPVNAAQSSNVASSSVCESVWDCDTGMECAFAPCDADPACEPSTGLDAPARCPLQCSAPDDIDCSEGDELNQEVCTSDEECDEGLACTPVASCQTYSCAGNSGRLEVDGECASRCLERPRLLSASFSDMRAVHLLLSHPVAPSPGLVCEDVLDNATLAQLGDAPRCYVHADELVVSLGVGAALSPGEDARFTLRQSQLLKSALTEHLTPFGGTITGISYPSANGMPEPPTAVISGDPRYTARIEFSGEVTMSLCALRRKSCRPFFFLHLGIIAAPLLPPIPGLVQSLD